MASYLSQLLSVFFLLSAMIQAVANLEVTTPPRVTVPLGGSVTIPCTTDSSDLEAIWWDKIEGQEKEIVIYRTLPSGDPTGLGLDSGDFNITANNSLVINYMRIEHEHSYLCTVLDKFYEDDKSITEVIAIVEPRETPTIKFSCHGSPCGSYMEEGDFVNLTCTSDEARPPVTLTWTNAAGIPIKELFNDTQDGSQLGTFVTSSTIQYKFKRETTLSCQADGEAVGKNSPEQHAKVELSLRTTEAPYLGTGSPGTKPPNAKRDNYNGTEEGEGEEGGLDLVTILMVAVAVSVLVVIILIVAVVVLYKKNQEYSFFPKSGKSYHRAEPEDYIRGYNEMSNKL